MSANPPNKPAPGKQNDPDEIAAKAEQQKKEARAPHLPHKPDAPKPAPPESGKPIWDKPHSS